MVQTNQPGLSSEQLSDISSRQWAVHSSIRVSHVVPVPALDCEAISVKGDRPRRRRRLFVEKPLFLVLGFLDTQVA